MPRGNLAKYVNAWMFQREKKRQRVEALRTRDGDNCWHCGNPMRFGPPHNIGKSATIEHLLPRSLGGTGQLDNLRLCHVGCNRHLGANPPDQKRRMRLTGGRMDRGSSPG